MISYVLILTIQTTEDLWIMNIQVMQTQMACVFVHFFMQINGDFIDHMSVTESTSFIKIYKRDTGV